MNLVRKLYRASVWEKNALPLSERKYRSLKRFWLPLYDCLAIWAGINAAVYGSRTLDSIFGEAANYLGALFSLVALICLAGVAFPKLWRVEVAGKVAMIGMIVGYMSSIWLAPTLQQHQFNEQPNWFVITMLAFGLPLALFRLNLLGEEKFERQVRLEVERFSE